MQEAFKAPPPNYPVALSWLLSRGNENNNVKESKLKSTPVGNLSSLSLETGMVDIHTRFLEFTKTHTRVFII